jgi:ABC-type Zn2+ transport system substrate-binding protein/surface adhesin
MKESDAEGGRRGRGFRRRRSISPQDAWKLRRLLEEKQRKPWKQRKRGNEDEDEDEDEDEEEEEEEEEGKEDEEEERRKKKEEDEERRRRRRSVLRLLEASGGHLSIYLHFYLFAFLG